MNSIIHYFRSAWGELTKVNWPTPKETARYTFIVLAGCVLVAAFFSIFDFGINAGLEFIISKTAA